MRYDPIYRRLFAQKPSTESEEETSSATVLSAVSEEETSSATVLSADEVRGIVSDALEERLNEHGIGDKLAKLDLLDELLGKANERPDHSTLVSEIDKLIQNRLKTFARKDVGNPVSNTGRKPGALGRWLGLDNS